MIRTPVFALVVVLALGSAAGAAPIFFGPTAYVSTADIPAGLYAGGSPTALENFEDGSLDFGITASIGAPFGPGRSTDSVDEDDGSIDGSGLRGHSYLASGGGAPSVTFTFASTVTAAGIVWTDGFGNVTFEAFGPGMVSLGGIGPVQLIVSSTQGNTAEDRFFGVSDLNGIVAIRMASGGGGLEVDHLQFGSAVGPEPIPEPATLALVGAAFGFAAWRLRRRRTAE